MLMKLPGFALTAVLTLALSAAAMVLYGVTSYDAKDRRLNFPSIQ